MQATMQALVVALNGIVEQMTLKFPLYVGIIIVFTGNRFP